MKAAMWILWPSFLSACVGEMLFFAFIDPMDLAPFWHMMPDWHAMPMGRVMPGPRLAVYALGFFFFWGLATLASYLTWVLTRPADEVNKTAANE